MRYLTLTQQHYDILYNNILNAGTGYDRKEVRLAAKILDRLEYFGTLEENGSYKLKEGDITLELEEVEYKLLGTINDSIKWNPRYVKETVRFLDWFEGAAKTPKFSLVDATKEEASQ